MSHEVSHDPHVSEETMPSPVGLPNTKLCMWLFLVSEIMFFAGLIGSYIVIRFGTSGWPNPYDILAVRITAFNTFLLICSSVTMVKAFQWCDYGNRRKTIQYLLATIIGGAAFVGIQVYEYGHLLEKPSTALLHHVESIMHDRGLPTGHGDDEESHARTPDGSGQIILASQEPVEGNAQNEQLIRTFEILAQGRPDIPDTAAPSRLDELKAWDVAVQTETIKLAALFPDDKKMRTLGRHHWLYPEGFVPTRDNFTSTFYIMTGFHGLHVAGGVVALMAIFGLYLVGKAGTVAIEVAGLYWHFVDLVWILLFTIVYLM